MKKVLSVLLAAALMLSSAAAVAEGGRFNFFDFFNEQNVTITKSEYDSLQRFKKLAEVYEKVARYYYEDPDEDLMMEGAMWGMLQALGDPYTFYYSPDDWQKNLEDDEGRYAGVGIQMLGNYQTNVVTISRVFNNTPAERAGLHKGDILVRVDDLTVTAETMSDAADLMRGKEAETVEIEVERRGEKLVFTVGREEIHVNWIESTMLDDQVGLIALYEFSGDCEVQLTNALKKLREQGATSLIIDLRDNGGGWVDAARIIADLFLDGGVLFYAENRAGRRDNYYTRNGKDDIPLVFLVNGGSASASEILSGSLQDLGRACVVGTKTYGKGIMQRVIELDGVNDRADGMQVTYAQYFMPSGRKVHKVGITPDIICEMPEELVSEYFELGDMDDVQLKKAWETAVALRDGQIVLSPAEPYTEEDDDADDDSDAAAFAPMPLFVSLPL